MVYPFDKQKLYKIASNLIIILNYKYLFLLNRSVIIDKRQ